MVRTLVLGLAVCNLLTVGCAAVGSSMPEARWPQKVYYRTAEVDGDRVFYRESGPRDGDVIVLLHGFPSSSHTYRELIPLLSGRFRVIAPDYLGSGFSDRPEGPYTFDRLARSVGGLLRTLNVTRYVLYLQDFGAPVGFRLALENPQAIRGLVIQNANAYLDGLTPPRRAFFRSAHTDRSPEKVALLRRFVSDEAITNLQYLRDVPGQRAERMSPDAWTHDIARMSTERDRQIAVQLFQDYQTNIEAYPHWQAWMKAHQPPALLVWGKRDPAFIAAGAEAYGRDLPNAEIHLLDAGHFAAEELPVPIAQHIIRFMARLAP